MLILANALRIAITVVAVAVLGFLGWRFILPLIAMWMAGVGVEIPFPKRFVLEYPKLATYLFVLGGPLLFIAIVIAVIWLLRLRWGHS